MLLDTRYDATKVAVRQRCTDRLQNGTPDEFTVSGSDWFHHNNFTALPILLVNPLALYGYGDINIVPAVSHDLSCRVSADTMHASTDT